MKIIARHTRLDRVSRKHFKHWIPAYAGMTFKHENNFLSPMKYLWPKCCMIRAVNTSMEISSDSSEKEYKLGA